MSFPGESIVAATVGGALSYAGAHEANRMNRKIAREQMGFQERMSNTAYQRARQDMIAAGINPLLMAGSGGASSPGGASATMHNELAGAVSSAIDARRSSAEVKNLEAQNKRIRAETDLITAEAKIGEVKTSFLESVLSKKRGPHFWQKDFWN